MRVPFIALSLLLAVASASAARYEISSISTSQQDIYVNNAWVNNAPCIEVTLRVTEDIGKTTPAIKAYFYTKDREMVKSWDRPSHISLPSTETFSAPESYKPGKKYVVYFGIPQSIQRGKEKWKHIVVVFGDRDQVAAEVYPKEDIQQFEFKEKALLGKTAAPAQPAAPAPAPPTRPVAAAPVPAGSDAFAREIATLPAEQQLARVVARLKELNPGFDGKVSHKLDRGAISELWVSTVGLNDLSPLRALPWLRRLSLFPASANQKGSLASLSGLSGTSLMSLWCHNNPISDLTPLQGLPLDVLSCGGTQITDLGALAGMKLRALYVNDAIVSDLSPLAGMPLTVLWCNNTRVTDLTPIQSAPLQEIKCDFVAARDAAILRGIKTLAKINDLPAATFWIKVGPVTAANVGGTSASRPSTATPARSIETIPVVSLQKTMMTSTGMELVWIPPGEFMAGSTPAERTWAEANGLAAGYMKNEGEQPRKVKISQPFWIGRTEVTVAQWKQFIAATSYVTDAEKAGESFVPLKSVRKWGTVKGASWKDPNFGFKPKDNHPVCCISWNDAVAFCDWLHQQEQKQGRLGSGQKIRLPTEAEWEYACRAGSETKFWWGDSEEGVERRMNFYGSEDGFEFVSPVDHYGSRGRNKFGLADMLGNVFEWCLDHYDPSGVNEEFHEGTSPSRVYRGGCFGFALGRARCAFRATDAPTSGRGHTGFRVCCGVPR